MEKNFVSNGNKLIAEFMGFKAHKEGNYIEYSAHGVKGAEFYSHINNGRRTGSWICLLPDIELGMKFHESWDWLMPVFNKCRDELTKAMIMNQQEVIASLSTRRNVKRHPLMKLSEFTTMGLHNEETFKSTEPMYKWVIEFIKWYNNNS